jgi:hypothetical protein
MNVAVQQPVKKTAMQRAHANIVNLGAGGVDLPP